MRQVLRLAAKLRYLEFMDSESILKLLRRHKPELHSRFDVVDLAVFGSTARGDRAPDSDVDILVSFAGLATSRRFFGAQFYLEDLLGLPVDLVTAKALRREFRPAIEREAIKV